MTTHLPLGSGMLLQDFWPKATTQSEMRREIAEKAAAHTIAETVPTGQFRAIPLLRDVNEKAHRAPSPDSVLLDGWKVILSGALKGVTPEALAALLPWASAEKAGRVTTLHAPAAAVGVRAMPRLSWVGATPAGMVLIEMDDAAQLGGVSLSFVGAGEGTMPFEFCALAQGGEAPFRVMYLE